jgi:hypothetical protein
MPVSEYTAQASRTPNEGRGTACCTFTILTSGRYGIPAETAPDYSVNSNCLLSRVVWLPRDETPGEVCPLSRGVMFQLLSTRLQSGFRFLPILLPAPLSARLTVRFPLARNDTGLPRFP